MNISSLVNIPKHFVSSVKRFPLTLICSFGITFLAMYMIEVSNLSDATTKNITHLMMTLSLGMLLSLALVNMAEKHQINMLRKYLLLLIPIGFIIIFYLISPENFSDFEWGLRYFVLLLSFSFIVAWLPFGKSSNHNAFWQYTSSLITKLIITQFFAYIITGGLSLALLAIDKLFGVKIDGKLYAHLWIIVQGIFMPVFFLGHIPGNYAVYILEKPYPKFMKILVLYILLPIVSLYMFILYMYALKILFTWELPTGWVSNLVLSFSITGLISFFLIYPLKNSANKYVGLFFKLFFLLKLPLLMLLYVAIFTRVFQYGITELRYYVLLLALWLSFVAVYMIVTKYNNLKIIFISFSLLAILSTFGPWGAFGASKKSQLKRFEKITAEFKLIHNGKLTKSDTIVPPEKEFEISSIVDYLTNNHGLETLKPYVPEDNYAEIEGQSYRWDRTEMIMNLMGLRHIRSYRMLEDEHGLDDENHFYFNYSTASKAVCEIGAYSYLIELNEHHYSSRNASFNNEYTGQTINVNTQFDFNTGIFSIKVTEKASGNVNELNLDLLKTFLTLREKYIRIDSYNMPANALIFKISDGQKAAEIQATQFFGYYSEIDKKFSSLTLKGLLLLKL